MASIFYKWLILFALTGLSSSYHPIFVSVTEIEHKAASKTLEITCKIFTDDFEKTLRKQYKTKIDLLDNKQTAAMNPLVNDYIKKHFLVIADGKLCVLNFLGFEQQEEGIVSYYEVKNIAVLKNVEVLNSILYEHSGQQMGIIHVTVNGQRKSSKLNNPDQKVIFSF